MRVHRGSLFWGIFFLLLGGIPLADREGLIDVGQLTDLGRLWPVAIIAVGMAVLVSRTQLAILGIVLAAVVLGGLAGGAIAVGGGFAFNFGDCGLENRADMRQLSRTGTLDAGGALDIRFNCGRLDVVTGSGDTWKLDASYRGGEPTVDASASRLLLQTPRDGSRRQEWSVVVPQDRLRTVDVQLNAGSATIDVSGSKLSSLTVNGNAGDVLVLGNGTLDKLTVEMNAGRARLNLGGPVTGTVKVNAGSIEVCAPAGAELRLTIREQLTFATNLDQRGLTRSGNLWSRAGSGGPAIILDVSGNAASFTLDPTGGCK